MYPRKCQRSGCDPNDRAATDSQPVHPPASERIADLCVASMFSFRGLALAALGFPPGKTPSHEINEFTCGNSSPDANCPADGRMGPKHKQASNPAQNTASCI